MNNRCELIFASRINNTRNKCTKLYAYIVIQYQYVIASGLIKFLYDFNSSWWFHLWLLYDLPDGGRKKRKMKCNEEEKGREAAIRDDIAALNEQKKKYT